jgi:cellulose synthase/poly-beta-1,6-N-acetylglucosamine synthase-like glycosyltransferase
MPFHHPLLDILFLISVVSIWLMIGYQIILTFAGYRYRQQTGRDHQIILDAQRGLEPVTILIPARNEDIVIRDTLTAMLQLDYPKSKLEILVINDGSTDETADKIDEIAAREKSVRQIILPKSDHGHGKAHALNVGMLHASYDLIAVYDADNRPQPDALKILVLHLISDEKMAAVIGKFRTINRRRNWLTRLINIETLAFQWILQAGRYHISKVAILPGTNYVIRKSALLACQGFISSDII